MESHIKKLKLTFIEDENKNIIFDCRDESEERFSNLEIAGLLSIAMDKIMEEMRQNEREV